MAILEVPNRMVFWEVALGEIPDSEGVFPEYILGFKIIYEINKPTTAELNIVSESYVENMFYVNQVVTLRVGFDRYNLIDMFRGKIATLPSGAASERMAYTVKIVGEEIKMTTQTVNRSYLGFNKSQIVMSICAKYGIKPNVIIKDMLPISATYIPIQNNKTDLQFLRECAGKWNCVMWFKQIGPTLNCYFVDADKAGDIGNILKTPNLNDLAVDYILGYRTDGTRNNVANVSWKFKTPKGGSPLVSAVTAFFSGGVKELPRDQTISYKDERWQLHRNAKALIAKHGYKMFRVFMMDIIKRGPANAETTLRKYFEQVSAGSRTNEQKINQGDSLNMTVTLNIGDPWLRPPRTAILFHGSDDPKAVSPYLPMFLWDEDYTRKFTINKVTTSLNDGKLSTEMQMTRKA